MESQELAKALGISGAYLSQLDRGVRTNPSTELLDKIAMVLCLNKIETETLYDLYAKVSRQISPDIAVPCCFLTFLPVNSFTISSCF